MASFNILLGEDNPVDVLVIASALDGCPVMMAIHHAWDGEQASDYLHKRREHAAAPTPDLIILDIDMPKKSGIQLLKEIKGDPLLRPIPTIILTASEDSADIDACHLHQADAFFSKPVQLQAFSGVVATIAELWLVQAQLSSEDLNVAPVSKRAVSH
jgi:chemotaxis family two-component system response regulator Rcp1